MLRFHDARPLAALAAVLLLIGPAPAQNTDLTKLDTSLKLVPADASFYSTSLRLGEQVDRFLASNAYAKLRALPAAKYAVDQLRTFATRPDNPLGQINQFFRQPANLDVSLQNEIVETVLKLGVKGIAVSVINPKEQTPDLKRIASQV